MNRGTDKKNFVLVCIALYVSEEENKTITPLMEYRKKYSDLQRAVRKIFCQYYRYTGKNEYEKNLKWDVLADRMPEKVLEDFHNYIIDNALYREEGEYMPGKPFVKQKSGNFALSTTKCLENHTLTASIWNDGLCAVDTYYHKGKPCTVYAIVLDHSVVALHSDEITSLKKHAEAINNVKKEMEFMLGFFQDDMEVRKKFVY